MSVAAVDQSAVSSHDAALLNGTRGPLQGARQMATPQKPGETPDRHGEYREVGPRGGEVTNPREVTIEPGDTPLPPTQKPGRKWERTGPPKR